MRTNDERRALLAARAAELESARSKRRLAAWGAASAGSAIALTVLVLRIVGLHPLTDGSLTGASLIGENAGGYAIVGVAAFLTGAGITAIIIRRGKKK